MPLYEYECRGCKNVFEFITASHEDLTTVECPRCHSRAVFKKLAKVNAGGSSKDGADSSGCPSSKFT